MLGIVLAFAVQFLSNFSSECRMNPPIPTILVIRFHYNFGKIYSKSNLLKSCPHRINFDLPFIVWITCHVMSCPVQKMPKRKGIPPLAARPPRHSDENHATCQTVKNPIPLALHNLAVSQCDGCCVFANASRAQKPVAVLKNGWLLRAASTSDISIGSTS